MSMNEHGTGKSRPPFALEVRWRGGVSLRDKSAFQKPLTNKERGQLKMLANALGSLTNEVVDWALANWFRFAQKAQIEAGLRSFPSEPHIGFLLTHCNVAVKLQRAQEQQRDQARAFAIAQSEVPPPLTKPQQSWDEKGRRKYNTDGEEIYYASPEELATLLAKPYERG